MCMAEDVRSPDTAERVQHATVTAAVMATDEALGSQACVVSAHFVHQHTPVAGLQRGFEAEERLVIDICQRGNAPQGALALFPCLRWTAGHAYHSQGSCKGRLIYLVPNSSSLHYLWDVLLCPGKFLWLTLPSPHLHSNDSPAAAMQG
jgi:hypothetical protein